MASLFIKSTKSRILALNFSFFLSPESSIFRAFLLSCRKTNHVERKILMFWDNVAGVYDLFADIFNKETHKALIAAVSSRITPDDAVLECACGTGLLTGAIAKRCRTLLATDFSANMLKRANNPRRRGRSARR